MRWQWKSSHSVPNEPMGGVGLNRLNVKCWVLWGGLCTVTSDTGVVLCIYACVAIVWDR